MKFYLQLHQGSEALTITENRPRGFYSYIYGPFEAIHEVLADMQRRWPNSKVDQFFVFDGDIYRVPPNPREKLESEKRAPGDESNWTFKQDGTDSLWHCRDCDAVIQVATVAHPIHSRLFPGAGSGQVHNEKVGYCPNCEKKPNFHGTPIIGED